MSRAAALIFAAISAFPVVAGCGKKGAPLPPLVRLPAAPAEISAARRGNQVVVEFASPAANTDGSRPANVSRVDVYGITTSANIPDGPLLSLATKIGSVAVKSPRDPNQTIEPDESAADLEPPQGGGIEQGARASLVEQLAPALLTPIEWPPAAAVGRVRARTGPAIPVPPKPPAPPSRIYIGVSIDKRGRTGAMSRRVSVPIVPAPPAPSPATVAYDESSITVKWTPPADAANVAFHVYEVTPAAPAPQPNASAPAPVETRLTTAPVTAATYSDSRMVWGATRCYTVRSVVTEGASAVESDEPAPVCVTLADTFPPAAPKGLSGVSSEGSISLIWEPNSEKDFAGYLVLRGTAGGALAPITPAPIQATIYNDGVPAGVRYVYAIVAVDTAGNRSAESNRFEEAGR